MPAVKNLIQETSSTTGTGNFTIAAVSGRVRFSDSTYGFGTGGSDVFDYYISNRDASEWERGTGSMSDANTLVRDTVIESSNSDSLVSFSAGTKDVTNDVPAEKQVQTDLSQTLTSKTLTSAVLNTAVSGTAVLDEDTMSSNSATQVATQQSIKAYVDTEDANIASDTLTFTNKTFAIGSNTFSGTTAQFNTSLSDGSFATLAGTETLTNKTFAIGSNTFSGTTAQFNTALSDGSFATLAGTETLTNKTIGAVTISGTVSVADNIVDQPLLRDYGEDVNAIGSTGGGTQDIDIELGNVVSATVDTSANTFTFSNPTATGDACSFTLILTNGGSQTVNWPASVDWAGATAPTLTTSGVDILTFVTIDAGTIWYGFAAGLDMS